MIDTVKEYIPQIIGTVLAILLLSFSKYIINKLIAKYAQLLQKSDRTTLLVRRTIAILLNITFVFIVAIIWGLQPHNLLIGLSSVFAVVGVALFAQWSVLSNITAGLIMFFTAPFRIGDRIHIIDKDIPIKATIENIHTFYTHIRTNDGELIVIPNNLFLQKIVAVNKEEDNPVY